MATTFAFEDAADAMIETEQSDASSRWRWLAAAGVVGIAALSLAAGYLLRTSAAKPSTVFALFLVASPDDSPLPRKARSGNSSEAIFRQTQANMIRSRMVLEPALQQPSIANLACVREHADPAAWLEQNLKVEIRESTKTIRISLTGDRPAELAAVVNAVANVYMKDVVADERSQRQMRRAECERIYRENQEQLNKKLADLQALSRRRLEERPTSGIVQQTAAERATALHKELEAIGAKLEKTKLQLSFERRKLQLGPLEKVPDYLLEEQLDRDPASQKLGAQRDRLKRIVGQYEKEGRAETSQLVSSSLKAYRADLQSVDKQLEKRRVEVRDMLERQLRQTSRQNADQIVKQLEEQVELMQEEEKLLRRRYDEQVKEVEKQSHVSWGDMEVVLKEIERKQAVIKTFADECESLRREMLAAPRVTLVLEASAGE